MARKILVSFAVFVALGGLFSGCAGDGGSREPTSPTGPSSAPNPTVPPLVIPNLTGKWSGTWAGNYTLTLDLVQSGANFVGNATEDDRSGHFMYGQVSEGEAFPQSARFTMWLSSTGRQVVPYREYYLNVQILENGRRLVGSSTSLVGLDLRKQ
jgi:hypothetical protein